MKTYKLGQTIPPTPSSIFKFNELGIRGDGVGVFKTLENVGWADFRLLAFEKGVVFQFCKSSGDLKPATASGWDQCSYVKTNENVFMEVK